MFLFYLLNYYCRNANKAKKCILLRLVIRFIVSSGSIFVWDTKPFWSPLMRIHRFQFHLIQIQSIYNWILLNSLLHKFVMIKTGFNLCARVSDLINQPY